MIKIIIKSHLWLVLICLLQACSNTPEKTLPYWLQVANDYMHKGVELYDRQQFKLAKQEFSNALQAYQRFDYIKGLAQANLNLAKTEFASEDYESAQFFLNDLKFLITDNNLTELSVHLDIMQSSILISSGRSKQAIEVMNKYLGTSGENIMALNERVYHALLINSLRASIYLASDSKMWFDLYENNLDQSELNQARLFRYKAQQASNKKQINALNNNFSRALNLYRDLANHKSVLITLREWANALMINNDELHSVNKFEALYKVAKSTDNVKVMKYARNQLVMLYAELGDEINQQRVSRW